MEPDGRRNAARAGWNQCPSKVDAIRVLGTPPNPTRGRWAPREGGSSTAPVLTPLEGQNGTDADSFVRFVEPQAGATPLGARFLSRLRLLRGSVLLSGLIGFGRAGSLRSCSESCGSEGRGITSSANRRAIPSRRAG